MANIKECSAQRAACTVSFGAEEYQCTNCL